MLHHQIFSKREWRHGKIVNHPEVNLMLYHSHLQSGSVNIVGVADTGAQSDFKSLEKFFAAGFREQDLSPILPSLCAQNQWCFSCNTGRTSQ